MFIRRAETKAEAPILWPPDVKSRLTGRDPDAGKDCRRYLSRLSLTGWRADLIRTTNYASA